MVPHVKPLIMIFYFRASAINNNNINKIEAIGSWVLKSLYFAKQSEEQGNINSKKEQVSIKWSLYDPPHQLWQQGLFLLAGYLKKEYAWFKNANLINSDPDKR